MESYQDVAYEEEEGIARVTFRRPERLNALGMRMAEELVELLVRLAERKEVRVVLFTGEGRAFSVGRDLKESAEHTPEQGARYLRLGQEVVERMERLPMPTIAVINGHAFGGGMEMALACDIRLAAEEATLCFPECSLGIFPGAGGTVRLPRLIPPGHARELIFAAKRIDGREAERLGVAEHAYPLARLAEEAEKLAAQIRDNGPLGVRAAKQVIRHALEAPPEHALAYSHALRLPLNESRDFREALAAFREKRKPQFTGE